ncbi:MAG TPA: hypothetical protein VN634_21665 [Candidatus Limnocylindrales bacterium]|nr:hypothetical protein [Candidatus Limnocylindrales bacterium]
MTALSLARALFVASAIVSAGIHPANAASCGDGNINTSEKCDDGNHVSGDGCNTNCVVEEGYACTGNPSVCVRVAEECGNNVIQDGEECDGGPCCRSDCTLADKGTLCRAKAGPCDVAETCTGKSGFCPVDRHSRALCRISQGICDPAEFCGPQSTECPADRKSTRVCREPGAPCDAAERCDGESNTCPEDRIATTDKICRPAAGSCDIAERCDGETTSCPDDAVRQNGFVCRPAVSPSCDAAEVCSGSSKSCPTDALIGCPDNDGIDCVHPACDASGGCTTTDDCVEICRQPPFWGGHSGNERDRLNVTQTILDQVGPLDICGQRIDSTDLGNLDSAVEALCVKARGVEERSLFRALVTTALNCAISEGGTCDQIVSRFVDVSFDDCNRLCAGTAVPGGPGIDECIDQLFCFNRGGTTFAGQCALGTCQEDPELLCGDDFNACPDFDGDGDPDRCEPFEGNCSDARLCTTNLDTDAKICVQGRALPSSVKLCRRARRNNCTIDFCR